MHCMPRHQCTACLCNALAGDISLTRYLLLRALSFKPLFLCMCSLCSVLQVAVQLNDTHPSMTVVEMMRYFMDVEKMTFDRVGQNALRISHSYIEVCF